MTAMTSRGLVLALMASTVALGSPDLVLTPGKLASVPRNGNARIEAVVTPSSPASTVATCRAYFRASGSTGFYFVDMKRGDAGRYWALLPLPTEKTTAVDYRIVAKDSAGVESTTALVTVPVGDGSVRLSADEAKSASNLVIGLTEPGQSGVPVGFKCDGIVNLIAVNGELKPNDECRKLAAAAASAGAVAASGWAPVAATIGVGAVVAAGGAIIISNNSGVGPPVSPSRPGATPSLGK